MATKGKSKAPPANSSPQSILAQQQAANAANAGAGIGGYSSAASGSTPTTAQVDAQQLDPAIANELVPGSGSQPGVLAIPRALDQQAVLQEIAGALGVTGSKGIPLTEAVARALAEQTGINPDAVTIKHGSLGGPAPILAEAMQKMGVNPDVSDPYAAIAQKLGLPLTTSPGQPQTVAEMYASFTKAIADNPTYKAQVTTQLEQAGLLDSAQASSTAALQNAYQGLLTQAVQTKSDPATVITNLTQANKLPGGGPTSEAQSYVQGIAGEFGVNLSKEQIQAIANQFPDPSAQPDEIKNAVTSLYTYDPNAPQSGLAARIANGVEQAAGQYQVPISQQAVGQMVTQALQGATVASMYVAADQAVSAATEHFKQVAAGMYPALANQINQGFDVQTLTDPYLQLASAYTGQDPKAMMVDDPSGKWSAFLQGAQDPKTGTPTLMTMDQWRQKLMSDPQYGFQNTEAAKNMVANFTTSLLNTFGKLNTGSNGMNGYTSPLQSIG